MPNVYISNGELIDKWTILEIKLEKLTGQNQILNVKKEIDLIGIDVQRIQRSFSIDEEIFRLKQTNLLIWCLMDELYKMRSPDLNYGKICFEVIRENQRRSFVKREIDLLTKEEFNEEKSYFSQSDWVIPDENS